MAEHESMSGLTPDEAKEFHRYYMQGLWMFVGIAVVAHLLTWIWRPWFHPEKTTGAASDFLPNAASTLTSLIG